MFYHMPLKYEALMHPCYFGPDLKQTIEKKIYTEIEGSCQGYVGYIVCITAITSISHGAIGENGMATFSVEYNAIVFRPFKNQVLDGIVKQVNKVGLFVDIGPLTCFVSHNSMPDSMEYCPQLNPPCYKSKIEDNDIIASECNIRVRIVGIRTDLNGVFVIGSLMDDYLGVIE